MLLFIWNYDKNFSTTLLNPWGFGPQPRTIIMNYYNQETHPDQKFFLTERSEDLLSEVQSNLAEVVKRAVAISDIEIQVNHGKRTLDNKMSILEKE